MQIIFYFFGAIFTFICDIQKGLGPNLPFPKIIGVKMLGVNLFPFFCKNEFVLSRELK